MSLTPRELEVVALVAKGYTRKQIAVQLGIGAECVSFHVRRAARRLALDPSRDPRVLLTRYTLGIA